MRALYAHYAREVRVEPSPALLAIDMYELAYQGGAKPVAQVSKTYPSSCRIRVGGDRADQTPVRGGALGEAAGVLLHQRHALAEPAESGARHPAPRHPAGPAPLRHPAGVRAAARGHGDHQVARERLLRQAPAAQLTQLGVQSLVLCGQCTSGCLRATAVEAYSHGLGVTIAEECCFDRSPISQQVNLFDLHHKYAGALHAAEVIAQLRGLKKGRGDRT